MPKILDNPLSWEMINNIINDKEARLFGRSKDVCKEYVRDKKKATFMYNSTRDMILVKQLNYKPILTKNDKIVGLKDSKCFEQVICNNTFPYYVSEGISHKLLWSVKDLTDEDITTILKKELIGLEYIYFRNPENLRSVPDIFHIHIFIRYDKD